MGNLLAGFVTMHEFANCRMIRRPSAIAHLHFYGTSFYTGNFSAISHNLHLIVYPYLEN